MTKFMDPSFSTYAPGGDEYAERWEATFGKRATAEAIPTCLNCPCPVGFHDSTGRCTTPKCGCEVLKNSNPGWRMSSLGDDVPRSASAQPSIWAGQHELFIAFDSVSGVPAFVGLGRPHLDKQLAEAREQFLASPYDYNIAGPFVLAASGFTAHEREELGDLRNIAGRAHDLLDSLGERADDNDKACKALHEAFRVAGAPAAQRRASPQPCRVCGHENGEHGRLCPERKVGTAKYPGPDDEQVSSNPQPECIACGEPAPHQEWRCPTHRVGATVPRPGSAQPPTDFGREAFRHGRALFAWLSCYRDCRDCDGKPKWREGEVEHEADCAQGEVVAAWKAFEAKHFSAAMAPEAAGPCAPADAEKAPEEAPEPMCDACGLDAAKYCEECAFSTTR